MVNNYTSVQLVLIQCNTSRAEVFSEKGVFGNFGKTTEKHLQQSLFFDKVAELRLQL